MKNGMDDEQGHHADEGETVASPGNGVADADATMGQANPTMGRLKDNPLSSDTARSLGIGGNPALGRGIDQAGARETADEEISVDQATTLNAD